MSSPRMKLDAAVRLSLAFTLLASCRGEAEQPSAGAQQRDKTVSAPREPSPAGPTAAGMSQALARIPADTPLALAVGIGPLRRARATAPLIERLLHAPQIALASAWLPACARTLADRAEWFVVGFSEVTTFSPSFATARGSWTREEAAACASVDERIRVVDDHTVEVHDSRSERAGTSAIVAVDRLPRGTTIRIRATTILDRLSAEAVITASDEEAAIAIETSLRRDLADVLAKPTLGMGSFVMYRSGSRVTMTLDAGPTMLGVIESALP